MKICSFNINGVRSRLDSIKTISELHNPDIICLQETKSENRSFPKHEIEDLGYHCYYTGEKRYNGVAILSRKSISNITTNNPHFTENQSRYMSCILELESGEKVYLINCYFPQGNNRSDIEKFEYKARFFTSFFEELEEISKNYENVIISGDFNICPHQIDVSFPKYISDEWISSGRCSFLPEERRYYHHLIKMNYIDSYRNLHPGNKEFTWFSYQTPKEAIPNGDAMRLDYIFTSNSLQEKLTEFGICYKTRKLESPSDHCPIILTLKTTKPIGNPPPKKLSLF